MWEIGTKTHTYMLLTSEEKIDVYREDREVHWMCFRRGEIETYIHVNGATNEFVVKVPTDMAQEILTHIAEQIRDSDCETTLTDSS